MIILQRGEGIFHCGSLQHPCKLLIYYLLLLFKYSSSSRLWDDSRPQCELWVAHVLGGGTSEDKAVDSPLTCGSRVVDGYRREEAIRGKMAGRGQCVGD